MNFFQHEIARSRIGKWRHVLIAALLILMGMPRDGRSLSLDARKIAMGGTLFPYHSGLHVQNPAYLKVREEAPMAIPVPIGLIVFLSDLPSFDPGDEDFDPIALASALIDPPFYLELIDSYQSDPTHIFIDLAQDYLVIDMDNLRPYMPTGPVDPGPFDIRQPRIGYTYREIYFGLSPFIRMEGGFDLSNNFEGVLAEAKPMEPNSDYTITGHADANIGLAINAGYVWELQELLSIPEGPRVLLGINGKYLMGFLYADIDNDSKLSTHDPIFDSEAPPELSINTLVDYAIPEGGAFGPRGHGLGADIGLLVRYPSFDVGFAVQDVYTRLNWRANRERFTFDESSNDIENEVLFENRSVRADIPRRYALSFAYRNKADHGWAWAPETGDYLIAYNLEFAEDGVSMHAGGETYMGPGPLALRFGAFNQGERPQVSFGVGVPLKFFNFDIAFSTHSSTFQRGRGLTLATSISLP